MDINASAFAKEQVKQLDFQRAQAVEASDETRRAEPLGKDVKLALEQVEKQTRELIESYFHWEQGPQLRGTCPIQREGIDSAAARHRYATAQIRRAARLDKGPKNPEWWKFIAAASGALASAWCHEWEKSKPQREAEERQAAERDRTTREHEKALKPNSKRIAELQSIIKDAATSEKFLADLYRALAAHEAAQDARKELTHMRHASEAAAAALGKNAPAIDVPKSANSDLAAKAAHMLHAATRRN